MDINIGGPNIVGTYVLVCILFVHKIHMGKFQKWFISHEIKHHFYILLFNRGAAEALPGQM